MRTPRLRLALLSSAVALTVFASHPRAAAKIASVYVPFEDLTDADILTPVLRKSARVDGRLVFYPAPTKEADTELARRAAGPPSELATQLAARHLAETRRQLGDMEGAKEALSKWASSPESDQAARWEKAASWGIEYGEPAFAFQAAAKALGTEGLSEDSRRSLATERIGWAKTHPEAASQSQMLAERASLFPADAAYTEEWIKFLLKEGKTKEAEEALRKAAGFPEERRVLSLAALKIRRGDREGAQKVLEEAISPVKVPLSSELTRSFANATFAATPSKPDSWRGDLEKRLDTRTLVLLFSYFQGKERGDLARQLLQQVELRHESRFNRESAVLMSRLWEAIDAIPEAFRSRLMGSKGASEKEQQDDLAALSALALRAGSRPLPWGLYNDEAYKWASRIDVTPGFFTGGLSFLLTGWSGKEALAELEARRLPERTFRTARLLIQELEKRAPGHPSLPGLYTRIMERHVQRGEGTEAMALLPKADRGSDAERAEARRIALLAARQTKATVETEASLFKERLRFLAADGSNPEFGGSRHNSSEYEDSEWNGSEGAEDSPDSTGSISLSAQREQTSSYEPVLKEAISRLSARDKSNRTSLTLLLGELDRLPRAESLFIYGANQIEKWNLDADLESRYRTALAAFQGDDWWKRLFRWYAKYKRGQEQRSLADDVVSRFRASQIYNKIPGESVGNIPLEGQPNPFVFISDYVRLRALERFPASPRVLQEAESHLITRTAYNGFSVSEKNARKGRIVIEDTLLQARRDAVLFVDAKRREWFINQLVKENRLEPFLRAMEAQPEKSPVELRLLLDGWNRLSKFEHSVSYASTLAELYPASTTCASEAVTLYRSLSGINPRMAENVLPIVKRTASAREDASGLFTNAGEMWQDLEKPVLAREAFESILAANPRSPETILEVSTIYWDYGRLDESLKTLEDGRKRLNRPKMHSFEAGVLREELKDINRAITEYLNGIGGESREDQSEWYAADYKSLRRLSQLMARPRVLNALDQRIKALTPGNKESEAQLLPLLHLLSLTPEEADPWDDWIDLPSDPVGREQKAAARTGARPREERGIVQIGSLLAARTFEMIPAATSPPFLKAIRANQDPLLDARWNKDPGRKIDLESLLMEREAALMPSEEGRIEKETARIRYLIENGRPAPAREAATRLGSRVQALPEGAAKLRSLATLARLSEETGGTPAEEFKKLTDRYPWSLGLLEDRLEFCFRTGRDAEGLDLLEKTAATAAEGHKQQLTQRLVKESLDRNELARGKRVLNSLLAMKLEPPLRISAAALLARLSYRENPAFNPVAFAKVEAEKLPEDVRPDLWAAMARASSEESKGKGSVDLWIEAINRRTSREWLTEASQTATQFHLDPVLLKFFTAQRERSPRDVRWAVAVRELKAQAGDLNGAIAAARDVCVVVPEKEIYWKEAVTLFERAGQFSEAAAFLDGWASSRRGDEGVASWRAALLVKAGQPQKAMEIERAALAAFRKEALQNRSPDDVSAEAAERTARIARRFLALNRPREAWAFAFPEGKFSRATEIPLSFSERTEMALRSGNFMTYFKASERLPDFLLEAADPIQRLAKPEDLSALQEYLISEIFPPGRLPSEEALRRTHSFAQDAGLYRFHEALTRGLLAFRPGIWPKDPPIAFVHRIYPVEGDPLKFITKGFEATWINYLVERDEAAALTPIVLAQASQLDTAMGEIPASQWLSTEAIALVASDPAQTALRQKIASWLSTKESWARVSRGMKGRINPVLLAAVVDEKARNEWLRWWLAPQIGLDPVLTARRDAEIRIGSSLNALLEGKPGSLTSADIVRLRGPRSVGDVLGADKSWTFTEFLPRPVDQGDDSIAGTGTDAGRLPGRLWGARPGEAWFVLESICRFREKDPLAPYVPLEASPRGGESDRTLLAVRAAEGLSNLPLALSLDETYFGDLAKADRLRRRIRLMIKAGGPEEKPAALGLFKNEIVRQQGKASEQLFREWTRIATDLALTPPLELLDGTKPVFAGLLAYLYDSLGPNRCRDLKPTSLMDFRAALASRWSGHQNQLTKEELEEYLNELWLLGAAPFPGRAAMRLEGMSQEATAFLARVETPSRKEALAAVRALPDTRLLSAFVDRTRDRHEESQYLLLRGELASGATGAALSRIKKLTDEGSAGALRLKPMQLSPQPGPEEGVEEPGEERAPVEEAGTWASSSRLRTILKIVRSSKNQAAIDQTQELFRGIIKKRLEGSWISAETWTLAVDLSTNQAELDPVLELLERSWVRRDYFSEQDKAAIVKALAPRGDAAARRWFLRMDEAKNIDSATTRAALLVLMKRNDEAASEWTNARERLALDRSEDLRAFDSWRRLAVSKTPPVAPSLWQKAAAFWKRPAAGFDPDWGETFKTHLSKFPYDKLSARNVLRSLAPAREAWVAPAVAALDNSQDVASWRMARFEAQRSAKSARSLLPSLTVDAASLRARNFPRSEIEGLLVTLAKTGAETGAESLTSRALTELETLKPAAAAALRPELAEIKAKFLPPPAVFVERNGTPTALRPRDLTWASFARVLNAEKVP